MTGEQFTFRNLSLAVRPPRVVMLIKNVKSEWQDTILRIIEWFTSCWGGCYGLIVPTDGHTIDEKFWWLMEKYDPDYIYRYVEEFIGIHPESNHPDAKGTQIKGVHVGSMEILADLRAQIMKHLNPLHTKNRLVRNASGGAKRAYPLTYLPTAIEGMAKPTAIFSPKVEASKEFQLLVYSLTGKVNDFLVESAKGIRGPDLQEFFTISFQAWKGNDLQRLLRDVWKGREQFSEYPFSTSIMGLSYYSKTSERFEWFEKPVLISGDTLSDFCLYYNLSRMRWNVYWLPMKLLEGYIDAKSTVQITGTRVEGENAYLTWLMDELKDVINEQEEEKDKKILLYSTSLAKEDFEKIVTACDSTQIVIPKEPSQDWFEIQPSIEQLLPYVRRIYERDGIGRAYVEQFHQGESINFLNTPIPKQFPKISSHEHRWITEVRIDGHLPPRIASLGPKTIINNYGTNETRISKEGPTYFCPNIDYFREWGQIENYVVRPKLRILDAFSMIEEIFKQAGYHVKYSDKGNYHRECSSRFGSFDKMAEFFIDEKSRNFLMKYLSTSPSEEGEGVWLQNEGRRYLCFNDIRQIVPADTPEFLDNLLKRSILYRGLIFQCEKCRNSAWYPIEEVTNIFKCSRCRTEQIYEHEHWKKPEEPRWYYQLDEVVYQGLTHNMHVPVLALWNLKKGIKEAFHYTPEIEIRKVRISEKPDTELDFVAILDGEIFVGEAKKENDISKTQLHRLKALTAVIQVKKVVLATVSERWNDGTIDNAKEIFGGNLLMLTKQDLLPASIV